MKFDRLGLLQYLLLIVTILVVSLFIKTRAMDVAQHNKRVDLILQLKTVESQLDQHVLSTASFQLQQYDPFVASVHKLDQYRQELASENLRHTDSSGMQFDMLQKSYADTLDAKIRLAEHIKSKAALIRNGLHYLPLAVEALQSHDQSLGDGLTVLLKDLLQHNLFPSESGGRGIETRLNQQALFISPEGEIRELLDNVIRHIRTNLTEIATLQAMRDRYATLPGRERLDDLYQWEVEEYAGQTRRSEIVSLALLLLAVVLLVGLGLALRWLTAAHRRSDRSWNQLRDAVASLSEAFALYGPDGRLVLHNQRFLEFYPWLKGKLHAGIGIAEVNRLNRQAGTLTEAGTALAGKPGTAAARDASFIERLSDGRSYMAGDTRTSAGETACVRVDITESKRVEQELRKLYRALEQSPASVIITDTQGIIEYANPKFEEVTGYNAREVIGQNPRILKSGDKSSEEYKDLWQTITEGKVWRGQFHNKRKDGSIYWESASISPVRDDNGVITHFIAVKEDITSRKRAEDQLRLNATVFETTTEGILVTDIDNCIKTVNPAFTRITGYTAEDVIGRNPRILSSGRHDKDFYAAMWSSLTNQGYWNGEIWNRRKDGTVYPQWLSLAAIQDSKDGIQEYVAVFSDITRRKQDEEQIRRQANYDALTSLPNRSLLMDRLDRSISSAQREGWQVALLFVDLDRFKGVNDTLGHVVGDELLQQVAERLSNCVRDTDTVARFGGDEFVIVLADVRKANDAAEVAKKVIGSLKRPFKLAGREVFIGASIGISLYPEDATDADILLRNADMAMYRAKDAGRNNYQFFTLAMNEKVHTQMELERDLRLALERDELALRYQPIVDVSQGRMVGVEALLTWHHPEHGMVMPNRFIPLAEETGLIGPIGHWVLTRACQQLGVWQRSGLDLRLNVNLSSRQLALGLSVDEVVQALDDAELQPESISLEITEGLILEGEDSTLQWLERVKSLGVGLVVDDFGTGYSSLSYLKRFPMDTLKIDQSFVRDLPGDPENVTLVQTIIAMAHSLGLKVVAEGVETKEQLSFLISEDCSLVQGYYYSRPVWPEQIPALVLASLPISDESVMTVCD